jgi:hypothetical protein
MTNREAGRATTSAKTSSTCSVLRTHMTVHDARRTCATLLVDLEVHPRVIMRIRREADMSRTLEIHSDASPMATREAQRRLGEPLQCSY